jgi:hypothetical protein
MPILKFKTGRLNPLDDNAILIDYFPSAKWIKIRGLPSDKIG